MVSEMGCGLTGSSEPHCCTCPGRHERCQGYCRPSFELPDRADRLLSKDAVRWREGEVEG